MLGGMVEFIEFPDSNVPALHQNLPSEIWTSGNAEPRDRHPFRLVRTIAKLQTGKRSSTVPLPRMAPNRNDIFPPFSVLE